MDKLVLNLLGGFRAQMDSGFAVTVSTKKGRALLAYLACHPAARHTRDTVAALFWGDMRQDRARHCLRQTLCVLRHALPESASTALCADADTLSIPGPGVIVDVVAFERLARESSVESLEEAATLYRGDLLAGIDIGEEVFEDWLRAERDRLHELALEVLAKLLARQCAAGAADSAIQSGLRLLSLDPLQEPVYRTLMRLYAKAGRPGAVLRQYQACVKALGRELGLEPEMETTQLLRELVPRMRRPALLTRVPV